MSAQHFALELSRVFDLEEPTAVDDRLRAGMVRPGCFPQDGPRDENLVVEIGEELEEPEACQKDQRAGVGDSAQESGKLVGELVNLVVERRDAVVVHQCEELGDGELSKCSGSARRESTFAHLFEQPELLELTRQRAALAITDGFHRKLDFDS